MDAVVRAVAAAPAVELAVATAGPRVRAAQEATAGAELVRAEEAEVPDGATAPDVPQARAAAASATGTRVAPVLTGPTEVLAEPALAVASEAPVQGVARMEIALTEAAPRPAGAATAHGAAPEAVMARAAASGRPDGTTAVTRTAETGVTPAGSPVVPGVTAISVAQVVTAISVAQVVTVDSAVRDGGRRVGRRQVLSAAAAVAVPLTGQTARSAGTTGMVAPGPGATAPTAGTATAERARQVAAANGAIGVRTGIAATSAGRAPAGSAAISAGLPMVSAATSAVRGPARSAVTRAGPPRTASAATRAGPPRTASAATSLAIARPGSAASSAALARSARAGHRMAATSILVAANPMRVAATATAGTGDSGGPRVTGQGRDGAETSATIAPGLAGPLAARGPSGDVVTAAGTCQNALAVRSQTGAPTGGLAPMAPGPGGEKTPVTAAPPGLRRPRNALRGRRGQG